MEIFVHLTKIKHARKFPEFRRMCLCLERNDMAGLKNARNSNFGKKRFVNIMSLCGKDAFILCICKA